MNRSQVVPRPRGPARGPVQLPEPETVPETGPDSVNDARRLPPSGRRGHLAAGLALLLAVVFLGSGVSKLVAPDFLVRSFETWGYGTGFMLIVGAVEIAAGVLVAIPATRRAGASLLGLVMLGAVATHLAADEWLAALVPLAVLAFIAVLLLNLRTGRRLAPDATPESGPSQPPQNL